MSKLWLLTGGDGGYDTYDSAVVVADTEEEAKTINPGGFYKFHDDAWYFQLNNGEESKSDDSSWSHPKKVTAEYIGEANDKLEKGEVVCASFNAG